MQVQLHDVQHTQAAEPMLQNSLDEKRLHLCVRLRHIIHLEPDITMLLTTKAALLSTI